MFGISYYFKGVAYLSESQFADYWFWLVTFAMVVDSVYNRKKYKSFKLY